MALTRRKIKDPNYQHHWATNWIVYGTTYGSQREAAEAHKVDRMTIKHWCNGRPERTDGMKLRRAVEPRAGCYSEVQPRR